MRILNSKFLLILVMIIMSQFNLVVTSKTLFSQDLLYTSSNKIIITDALGRTIILDHMPTRIVSLAPSITEILFYLELEDYLIGVDSISYNDTYYGIRNYVIKNKIADLGGYWWSTIKVEEILKLKPDLILADKGAHQPLLQLFESYNLTVIYLNGGSSKSIGDIYSDLSIIAEIYRLENKVINFIEQVEEIFKEYREKLVKYQNFSILVIIDVSNGIWIAGRATFIDDILLKLGLRNAAMLTGWKAIGIEEIYEWGPEVIIVASEHITETTLRDLGIYNLGVTVVFLDKEGIDSLLRPGPLILRAPKKIYEALQHGIEQKTVSTSDSVAITELYPILLYAIPALVIGLALGILIGRIKR